MLKTTSFLIFQIVHKDRLNNCVTWKFGFDSHYNIHWDKFIFISTYSLRGDINQKLRITWQCINRWSCDFMSLWQWHSRQSGSGVTPFCSSQHLVGRICLETLHMKFLILCGARIFQISFQIPLFPVTDGSAIPLCDSSLSRWYADLTE